MALFEKKDVGNRVPGVAECDARLAKLEEQKKELLFNIGLKFVKNNSVAEATGTIFEEEMKRIQGIDSEVEATETKKLALQGLRKCDKCGNVLVLDSMFCNKCGEKLEPMQTSTGSSGRHCPKCGNPVGSDEAFCSSCGNKI